MSLGTMGGEIMLELKKIIPASRITAVGASPSSTPVKNGDGSRSVASDFGGVILAGTHPWGRCALDSAVPRPLLPVANRPLIHYSIDWMVHPQLGRITICGNSDTPALRGGLAEEPASARGLDYYVDVMPRGPAGCVRDAAGRQPATTMLVADGTIVPEIELVELLEAHSRSKSVLTVVVARSDVADASRGDLLVPVGIYVFSPEALEMIPAEGYQDIKENLIPKLHGAGLQVGTFVARAQAARVTGADAYAAVNDWAIERLCASPFTPPEHQRQGDGLVHVSACVHAGAQIIGPVLVGPEVVIGRNACIVGPTSLGARSRVEADAVVSRSAVWDDSIIEPGAYVDRCVVAFRARVAAESRVRATVLLPDQAPPLQTRLAVNWPSRPQSGARRSKSAAGALA